MALKVTVFLAILAFFNGAKSQDSQNNSLLNDQMRPQPYRVITLAVPDAETARKFGRDLVGQGLAATVNIFPSTISMYVWNNEIRELPEHVMYIYTHSSQYDKIEAYVRKNHVHVEPGIVMFPIVGGSPSFFSWLEAQVRGGGMQGSANTN